MLIPWLWSAFALAILVAWGVRALAEILDEDRLLLLIPAGMIFGPTTFTFLLNLLGRGTGVRPGAILVLSGMAAWTLARHRWGPRRTWRWGAGRALTILFLLGGALLSTALAVGGFTTRVPDPEFHLPVAATIANGNLPVRDPFAPERPVEYHYGSNLCAGALAAWSGLPAWHAYLPGQLWFGWGAWGLALALGGLPWPGRPPEASPGSPGPGAPDPRLPSPSDGSPLAGALAAGLLFFGAGLRFLDLGDTPFGHALAGAAAGSGAWPGLVEFLASVDLRLLANELDGPLGSSPWSPPNVSGVGVLLCFFVVFRAALCSGRRAHRLVAGLLLGALELFRQDLFVLAIPATFVSAWAGGAFAGDPLRKRFGAVTEILAIGGICAALQGAVVSRILGGWLGLEARDALGFALKSRPHWVAYDLFVVTGPKIRTIHPGEAGWTWPFLADAAPAFLLLLPAAAWALARRRAFESFTGCIAVLGVLAGLLIDIPREPRATIRLLEIPIANLTVAGLLAAVLAFVQAGPRGLRLATHGLVWTFVVLCALPPLGYIAATMRWGVRENPLGHLGRAEIEAGQWLREHVPIGPLAAGLDPMFSGHFEGTGGYSSRRWKYPRREAAVRALAERDFEALRELGIEYVAVRLRAGDPAAAMEWPPGVQWLATFGDDGSRIALVRLR